MKYLNELLNFNKSSSNFQALHLNINSILNYLYEVNEILNSKKFDFVCFSETKLDETIPNTFFKNNHYNKIRLDRTRHGGGLLVFIKYGLSVTKTILVDELELIYTQFKINSQRFNFVYCYRPPNTKEKDILDKLDDFIHTLNLSEPLFIFGDLNMNYDPKITSNITYFCTSNDLINFIHKPTRVCSKYYKKTNKTKTTSTLIDLLLHNGNLIEETDVIPCPFSDHNFVVASLLIKKPNETYKTIKCRNLCQSNQLEICSQIKKANFKSLQSLKTIEEKWHFVKGEILNVIDRIAPERIVKIKKSSYFPWYDDELIKLKHLKDSAYKRSKRTLDQNDKDIYEYYNKLFKDYNDQKLIEYFKDKSLNDFKNSKKFWEFYSSKINIKSDKSEKNPISHIKLDGQVFDNKNELSNVFNCFFTSISSSSDSTLDASMEFIERVIPISEVKKENNFKFSLTNSNETNELLSDVQSSSAQESLHVKENHDNNELNPKTHSHTQPQPQPQLHVKKLQS
ncbi:RNA-directed DNA polymerase from mobile element jockey-like [Brachionus plicatilis]|uniref:RNA-directed DNA polymerase from mobile element jockey-like n=1 Tax=Brachionus plicatilis TaxID=10195 RepID=A0A3M7PY31_BRAPC|nr:RNA-directed DNA polymerase from mobile element jockey-like [Brachionus plicatilis]